MSTTTPRLGSSREAVDSEPWLDDGKASPSRLRVTGRRRSVPYLLLGVLLVLVCAGGFVLLSLNGDNRRAVLALGRDVTVGHVLTAQDLRQVSIAVDPGVAVVGLDQAASVIGRPMATSLAAGSLVTPRSLGAAMVPSAGRAVAALALKPGQFPPEVAAGAPVSVVVVASTAGPRPTGDAAVISTRWPAVVTSVTPSTTDQTTVVSVELAEDAAGQVAAIPAGQLAIVMLSTGGS